MTWRCVLYPVFCVHLALFLGGCSTAGGLTLRQTVDEVSPSGYSYDQIYEAARESLKELGVVLHCSRDRGVIVGQIPPFRVRASMERTSSQLRIEGLELDRSGWQRDSFHRKWMLASEGKTIYRSGAETLDDAVTMWGKAVRQRIP